MITPSCEAQKTIQSIVEKLVAEYKPQRVILFGSYAYGNPRQDSDIEKLRAAAQ